MRTLPITYSHPFIKAFFFLYVLLVIVQDLPSQLIIGTIARSPYILLSPLVFVLILLESSRLFSVKVVNVYVTYFIYSLIISVAWLIYYIGFKQLGSTAYDENLLVKFFKASMYNFIIILTLYNFIYIFKRFSNTFVLLLLRSILWCQLFVGFIQFISPEALRSIKTPELNPVDRLSLLNSEPSLAFPQLFISFLCFAAFKLFLKSKFTIGDMLMGVATIALLLAIQSRGGLVLAVVCLLAIILFTKQKLERKLIVLVVASVAVVPMVYIIVEVIIPGLVLDIQEFNSVSTRSITILSSLVSLFQYPLGQGYSTYLITFPPILTSTMNWVLNTVELPLLTSEIDEMIVTGRALTVKSGLLNEVLYTGWAVIIFYFAFFKEAFRKLGAASESKGLLVAFRLIFIFIIINFLFVSTWETSYIIPLSFALLEKVYFEVFRSRELSSAQLEQ